MGAVRFSGKMLETLIDMQADVVGVCTLERAPFNADHLDLSGIAAAAGIPVRYTPDINSADVVAWVSSLRPDVVFCVGWSRLIRSPMLTLAPLGVVGYHPAALPANRGRHPLIWALALGLKQTGSTFFVMDEGADSGDILSQRVLAIEESDDAKRLYERMIDVAAEQLIELVSALQNGTVVRMPQNQVHANYWRKRSATDGEIDWRMTAESIHNLIRALARPYPGAHFAFNGGAIKVWRSETIPDPRHNIEPGKVLTVSSTGAIVKAGDNAIRLIAMEPVPELIAGDYL